MRRTLSSLRPVFFKIQLIILLALAGIIVLQLFDVDIVLPGWSYAAIAIGLVVLYLLAMVSPASEHTEPVTLDSPVRGEWCAVNSPGQQIPSHGTRTRGQLSAIDVCGVFDADAPPLLRWGLRGSAPEAYACFGAEIHAMAGGIVTAVLDFQRDHRARNTWQSLAYMFTLEGWVRDLGGTHRVLGNHVIVDHGDDTYAVYAHLRRGSARVDAGTGVNAGTVLGEVGNTGNSSMPHLHVHLMDRADADAAAGIPLVWRGIELTGDLDEQMAPYAKDPEASALRGMPRNAEIFRS